MEFLFGNYDTGSEESTWEKGEEEEEWTAVWEKDFRFMDFKRFEFYVTPTALLFYQENGADWAWLVTHVKDANAPSGSPVTCGSVGLHHFKKVGAGWALDMDLPLFTCQGSYGLPDDPKLVSLGPDATGLAFGGGFLNNGITETYETWYYRDGEAINKVFFEKTEYDTKGLYGDEAGTTLKSTISLDASSDGPIQDVLVARNGTVPGSDWGMGATPTTPPQEVDSTLRYQFRDGVYRKVE